MKTIQFKIPEKMEEKLPVMYNYISIGYFEKKLVDLDCKYEFSEKNQGKIIYELPHKIISKIFDAKKEK